VSAAPVTSKVSDEVERERIEWDKYKWSDEIKEKRLQREADVEKRMQGEADIEEKRLQREAEIELRAKELALREK